MSSNRTFSTYSKGSLSDHELTPRPLKVNKDLSSLSSNADESFVTAFENSNSSVPRRKSSLNQEPSARIASGSSQVQPSPPSREPRLHIPKQRTDLAKSRSPEDAKPYDRGELHNRLFLMLGRKHAEREASILQKKFRKAVRSGVLPQRLSRKLIKPASNMTHKNAHATRRNQSENLPPSMRDFFGETQQRAVTDGNIKQKIETRAHQTQIRRLSIKDRILGRSTDFALPGIAVNPDGQHRSQTPAVSGIQSIQSSLPSTTFSTSSFDQLLAGFPHPPKKDNLPSDDIRASKVSSSAKRNCPRELSEPCQGGFLTGKLSFTPEFDSVSFENGESLFAMVQFEATLKSTDATPLSNDLLSALDAVIVIDNAAHTSPSTLMTHCETARYIASVLDPSLDRIGVLCAASEGKHQNTLLPLAQCNAKQFKKAIDRVDLYCDGMRTATLFSLVEKAQSMLLSQVEHTAVHGKNALVYGQIFVLTHQADSSLNEFSIDPRLSLHLVCGDAVPVKAATSSTINGWRILSLSGDCPRPASKHSHNDDPNGITERINDLLSHARTGRRSGFLKDVEWELCSCKDTTIEKVWGADRLTRMQPGEVSTLIVKIRCNMPKLAAAFRAGSPPSFDAEDDMFDEVERLFAGLSGTPLLRAAVSYSHPNLPEDTVCASMGTCHARRFISSPGSPTLASRPKSALFSAQRVAVHKALALHCFTEHGHVAGVVTLRELLGEGSKHFTCGKFVAALVKQQQYQAIRDRKRFYGDSGSLASSSLRLSRYENQEASPSISPCKRERDTSGNSLPESKRIDDVARLA